MTEWRVGVYQGSIEGLMGKRALLLPDSEPGWVQAQFNFYPPEMNENNNGGPLNDYCFGWHPFTEAEFEVEVE